MAVESTKIDAHWNYFLSMEQDLERLSRFVEVDKRNYECFSVEIARLLIAAAAEAEVVCKQLCQKLNTSSARNIHQYRKQIVQAYSVIPRFEVIAPRYGLHFKPWAKWKKANDVPLWWTAYNKIKHNRDSEYHRANLKNVPLSKS
jgi:hypothetical protein